MSSDLSKIREMLKKQVEEKAQYATIPQKFEFTAEGQELFAKVVRVQTNPWREGKLYIVQNLDDGKIYRLPTHRVLERELEDAGVGEGDIVLIKLVRKYTKEVEGEEREVHVYVVSKYSPKGEKKSSEEDQRKYVEELLKLYDGKIPKEQFEYFIKTVRGWDPAEIMEKFGLTEKEGAIVKK